MGGKSYMRAEIEQIVGAAALDDREVRDHWPLGLMEERDGVQRRDGGAAR